MRDLDLSLLRTFVSVVDAGGFTRGAERVHRTQSTVSQQIRKLEEQIGRPLLMRTARSLDLTDDGERLLGHARRLLRLADATLQSFEDPISEVVRIGLPEDYAVDRLPALLSRFAEAYPAVQLEVRCELSISLRHAFDQGELDLALVKETESTAVPLAQWADPLAWAVGEESEAPAALANPGAAVPLVVFPQGCVYRERAIHLLEHLGRRWRIAYTSPSLAGVQAALRAGLGLAPLSLTAWGDGLCRLSAEKAALWGLPPLPAAQRSLYGQRRLAAGAQALADLLIDSLRDTPALGFSTARAAAAPSPDSVRYRA
jgi:DNA-binding transcriptional LysR family regulator